MLLLFMLYGSILIISISIFIINIMFINMIAIIYYYY